MMLTRKGSRGSLLIGRIYVVTLPSSCSHSSIFLFALQSSVLWHDSAVGRKSSALLFFWCPPTWYLVLCKLR
ncbi:hypothetical protein C8J56DRAFT_952827 [Mycena floridula]|nr:hypothetical protein C8J56DRAFT_952827 [Mycena floridula]